MPHHPNARTSPAGRHGSPHRTGEVFFWLRFQDPQPPQQWAEVCVFGMFSLLSKAREVPEVHASSIFTHNLIPGSEDPCTGEEAQTPTTTGAESACPPLPPSPSMHRPEGARRPVEPSVLRVNMNYVGEKVRPSGHDRSVSLTGPPPTARFVRTPGAGGGGAEDVADRLCPERRGLVVRIGARVALPLSALPSLARSNRRVCDITPWHGNRTLFGPLRWEEDAPDPRLPEVSAKPSAPHPPRTPAVHPVGIPCARRPWRTGSLPASSPRSSVLLDRLHPRAAAAGGGGDRPRPLRLRGVCPSPPPPHHEGLSRGPASPLNAVSSAACLRIQGRGRAKHTQHFYSPWATLLWRAQPRA